MLRWRSDNALDWEELYTVLLDESDSDFILGWDPWPFCYAICHAMMNEFRDMSIWMQRGYILHPSEMSLHMTLIHLS